MYVAVEKLECNSENDTLPSGNSGLLLNVYSVPDILHSSDPPVSPG